MSKDKQLFMNGGDITLSNVSMATSNSNTSKSCATSPVNPSFSSSGTGKYAGTFFFRVVVAGGTCNFTVCYEIHRWKTSTEEWVLYDQDHVTKSESNGTYNHYLDFAGPTAANGRYHIRCWVCTLDAEGDVLSIKGGNGAGYIVNHNSDDDDPLPEPEPSPGPYPGDDPPIDHPELPPSGPVGPGAMGTY